MTAGDGGGDGGPDESDVGSGNSERGMYPRVKNHMFLQPTLDPIYMYI